MMTRAEDLLQFAVRFTQTNLDRLRAGDWLNLKEDLGHFLLPPLEGDGDFRRMQAFPHEHPKALSAEDIRALQRDLTEVLVYVADLAEHWSDPTREPVPCLLGFRPRLSLIPGLAVVPGRAAAHITPFFIGPSQDAILMQVIWALTQAPLDTVRRCPECGTIFYRVRHQRFCSATCRNRVNTRHFREVRQRPERADSEPEPETTLAAPLTTA
jgi:hypothetical protein